MKDFISKYQLKVGLLLSVLFPGIFVFSEDDTSHLFNRFFSSFSFILILWFITFSLLDFKRLPNQKANKQRLRIYGNIALSFLLAIILYFFVGFAIDNTGKFLESVSGDRATLPGAWFFLCLRIIFFNVLVILIKYLFDSYTEKRKIELENEILKREHLNAIHETLKQQVNPHFLFNSLNTLKSLVKRDGEQAILFINELSTVYRYMLLHRDKKIVSLGEEIDFLKSYLCLLKIRFGEAIHTQIDIPDELLNSPMPPNTLQLLIENAVKHNALSSGKPLSISLYISEDYLVVENNLQYKKEQSITSNFGLQNINQRYQLLNGKDIIIRKNEKHFRVFLPVS